MEIRLQCFDILPRRVISDKVMIIESLPLLGNGKINRLSLLKTSKKLIESKIE